MSLARDAELCFVKLSGLKNKLVFGAALSFAQVAELCATGAVAHATGAILSKEHSQTGHMLASACTLGV